MALENKVCSIKHLWIFLSGQSLLMPQGLHSEGSLLYRTAGREWRRQDSTYILPWTCLPWNSFHLHHWNKHPFLSARCTSSGAVCQHWNSSSTIYWLYILWQVSYLLLSFLLCKTGKTVGPIQLINVHVMSIKYSYKRRMPNAKSKGTGPKTVVTSDTNCKFREFSKPPWG